MIRRSFLALSAGVMHVRESGSGGDVPLLLAHGGPGSSTSLLPLIGALSSSRRVIAPDMLGHGDSDAPPAGDTSILAYAECLLELLDFAGIAQIDAYGHHTGGQVVTALAVIAPKRVRRLVLDGIALFPAAERAEYLHRYAPPLEPRADGGHLAWTWWFASELTRHFPYYRTDEAHELKPMIDRTPEVLTDVCVDMLKGWRTWHLAYNAAFRDDVEARLRQVSQPALVLRALGDPLSIYAERATSLLSRGSLADVERHTKAAAIAEYCDADLTMLGRRPAQTSLTCD